MTVRLQIFLKRRLHRIARSDARKEEEIARQVEPSSPAADSCSGEPADREFTIPATFRSEVIRQSTYHMIDQVRPIQTGCRPSNNLILIESQVHIIEFILGKQSDVFIEEELRSSQGIETGSGVVRRTTKLIGGFGKEHA